MLQESPQDLSGGLRDLRTPELLRERCDFAFRRLAALAAGTVAVSVILSAFLWRSQPLGPKQELWIDPAGHSTICVRTGAITSCR